MRRGYTLVEVIVALVLLEVGIMGAAGTMVLALRALVRAEHLERAVSALEGVVDSLRTDGARGAGVRPFAGGEVRWGEPVEHGLLVVAVDPAGDTLVRVQAPAGPP